MYLIYTLHYAQRMTSPQTWSDRVRPAKREPWLWQRPATSSQEACGTGLISPSSRKLGTQTQSPDQQVTQECTPEPHQWPLSENPRYEELMSPIQPSPARAGLAEQVLEHREGTWPCFPGPSRRVLGKSCFPQLKSNQLKKSMLSTSRCERERIYLHHYFLFTICPVYIIKFSKKLVLN